VFLAEVGVDYHPSFQTIAFLIEETGERGEQELKTVIDERFCTESEYWTPKIYTRNSPQSS
jgi:hypothetical protein